MKIRFSKEQIMQNYYSDEELKESMRMSAKQTLKWLAEANRFFNRVLSKKQKKLQERLAAEGW